MKKIIGQIGERLKELKELRTEIQEKKSEKTATKIKKKGDAATQQLRIEIGTWTVVKVLLIVALFMATQSIILELKSILIITGISFFIAIGVSPILERIESYHIPRPLAILLLYILFLGILGILFARVIPIIAEQLIDISYDIRAFILEADLTKYPWLIQAMETVNFDPAQLQSVVSGNIASIAQNLQGIAGSTFGILSGIFQGVFNFILALVLIFFILLERESIGQFSLLLLPEHRREYVHKKFSRVQDKMAEWFKGQFILMLSIGIGMYIGMKLFEVFFGMQYAATIGLVAGVMELFPYIGVIITGALAFLIAINISVYLGIAVLIWMAIVQFVEGNVLVPMVMHKVVGLSSVVVILALAAGGILGNALGGIAMAIIFMIFSVPVAASVAIFVEEYVHRGDK